MGRVLLVDDDPVMILDQLSHALGAQGMAHLIQDHHRIVIDQQHSSHKHRSQGGEPGCPVGSRSLL